MNIDPVPVPEERVSPRSDGGGFGKGSGDQTQPKKPLRELFEDYVRRLFEMLPMYESQLRAVSDWMYKWDPVSSRWIAKAVGAMSEEERAALRAQGFMTYDEAVAMKSVSHGTMAEPMHPYAYYTQLTPVVTQQLASLYGVLIPMLQLMAQIESAEARGGGGGFLDFLGKLVSIFLPIFKK
jgi:hypothetical protein